MKSQVLKNNNENTNFPLHICLSELIERKIGQRQQGSKMKSLKLFLLFVLVSCKVPISSYKASVKREVLPEPKVQVVESIFFAGLKEATHVSDTTVTLRWDIYEGTADAYDLYRLVNGKMKYVTTAIGQSITQLELTDLDPASTYTFVLRVRIEGYSDANTFAVSITTLAAPVTPVGLELAPSTAASSSNDTPSIKVFGVKKGDQVELYSENCSQKVAQGLASSDSITLTTSSLAIGTHDFRARSVNSLGSSSECSAASLSYTRLGCDSGYRLTQGQCILSFSGVHNVSDVTDSTLTINWQLHPLAVAYDLYYVVSGTPHFITSILVNTQSSLNLTGLVPGSAYNFRLNMRTSAGLQDNNTNDLTVQMNEAPAEPTVVTLIAPVARPTVVKTPIIKIEGLKAGDTVKLYNDSNCSQEIATGLATGHSLELTTTPLAQGTHVIRARAIGINQNASTCSSSGVEYVVSQCPENYLAIKSNIGRGTNNEFCVAKYEMKNVGNQAVSQPELLPWLNMSPASAKAACTDLGTGYDLISNQEWMTIAEEIESQGVNWTTGVVGSGSLYRGHSDNNPSTALAVTDINNKLNGTGTNTNNFQRRTLLLEDGQEIWDFSGNAGELIDWNLGGQLDRGPTTCSPVSNDFFAVSCADLTHNEYMPLNPGGVIPNQYNLNYGIGRLFGVGGTNSSNQGYGIRGGGFNLFDSGVYRLSLNLTVNATTSGAGFRCVYRF